MPPTTATGARASSRRTIAKTSQQFGYSFEASMTYIAKPKLHHPGAAEERHRFHASRLRGPHLDAVRGLRARFDSRGADPGLLRARHRAAPRGQAVWHRLLVEDAGLFPRASHGFNSVHGRMPSVLTGANLANRDLIYLGVSGDGDSASHRPGPVRPLRAARREHGLYLREQRRLRPDQGPVLRHRRQGLARARRR